MGTKRQILCTSGLVASTIAKTDVATGFPTSSERTVPNATDPIDPATGYDTDRIRIREPPAR